MKVRSIIRVGVAVVAFSLTSTVLAQSRVTPRMPDIRLLKNVPTPSSTFLQFVEDSKQNAFVEFSMPEGFYDVHPEKKGNEYPYPLSRMPQYYLLSYDKHCKASYPMYDFRKFYSLNNNLKILNDTKSIPRSIASQSNADAVFISYSELSQVALSKDPDIRYSHILWLYICKIDRPITVIQVLLSEDGKKNEAQYIKNILRSIKYLDDNGQMKAKKTVR